MLTESWVTVAGSPHFDEFCLIFQARGPAVVHQNCFCLSFAQLVLGNAGEWAGGGYALFTRLQRAFHYVFSNSKLERILFEL